MTTYAVILDSEVDPESPMTTSLWFRSRDNPLAIFEGDATAIAASKALAIEYDSGSGTQTGIITDVTDQTLSLRPDGAGGAEWGAGGIGQYFAGEVDAATTTVGNSIVWTEIVDVGSNFVSDTFTVPSDGAYEVYVHLGYVNSTGSDARMSIKKNANNAFQLLSAITLGNAVDRTMIFDLVATDTISVYIGDGGGSGDKLVTGWAMGDASGSDVIKYVGKAYFSIRRVA